MDCLVEAHDGVTVVRPQGDLDAESVGSFQSTVETLLREGTQYFVIDLASVSFVDSSGLASLVRLYKHVRIGEGDVRLAQVPAAVMTVLELTRLSRVFDIYPTADEAAATIRHQD
jgi:anti-sigma B factor antagonist